MHPSDRVFVSIFRVHGFGLIRGEEKTAPDFSSCYISFYIGGEPSFAGRDNISLVS